MKRRIVQIHEAQAVFFDLIREVEAGTDVVIENHGKPVARLVGYRPSPTPRTPGMLAGQIKIKPGFDAIPDGFVDAFE